MKDFLKFVANFLYLVGALIFAGIRMALVYPFARLVASYNVAKNSLAKRK